ncbi:MAG: GTPase domain-containing protein [Promethearchaeia archaeon]
MKKSEKILFTGKPNAGKTTLIEVFFNGESSKKLLNYFPPSPTHGYDTQVLNLQKKIGIFDLSGQENKRWFESEDRSIFYNTSEIINVIDVTTPKEEILSFAHKILDLRDEIVPSAKINLLIHKIDLINSNELHEIKEYIQEGLKGAEKLEIYFTSIKKDYFLSTFEIFIKILKNILKRKNLETEQIDLSFLKNTLTFVDSVSLKEEPTEEELMETMKNLSPNQFSEISELLLRKRHLKCKKIANKKKYSLTEKGEKHFQEILEKVSLKDFKTIDSNTLSSILPQDKKIPPFAGGLIADKDGKTICILESEDNLLENTLKQIKSKEAEKFDIELIPMFVSALEKFSKEINVKDLTGLNLMGNRLRMQVFSYGEFTVTCFFNSNIKIEKIAGKIRKHFKKLFQKYGEELKKVLVGKKEFVEDFRNQERIWIKNLNQKYKETKENMEYFDFDLINSLYQTINQISERKNKKYKKIRKLKKHLLKAAVEENIKDLKRINNHIQKLKTKELIKEK